MADDYDDEPVEYDPGDDDDSRWLLRSKGHADWVDALYQQQVDRQRFRSG